jgi:hypothetical protein
MKLKNIAGLLAVLLFAFAAVACNNDSGGTATDAPAASPAASEPAA